MDTISLDVFTRDPGVRARKLLASDMIPVEFYGRGIENLHLKVDYQTFRRAFIKAGSNTILEVDVDGGKSKMNAIVHDVQYDPVRDTIIHVDLMKVVMTEKIHAKIPLTFVGIAPAVKELGGTLATHIDEVEVSCLPGDLVHSIEVNVESLVDFHTFLRVKDLVVEKNMEILVDEEAIVAAVVAPKVESEAPVEAAEVAPAADAKSEGAA